jgi:hypothetical protein
MVLLAIAALLTEGFHQRSKEDGCKLPMATLSKRRSIGLSTT